ncbi:nucleotidyltransferase family protein [Vagococcus carniphilus]|uniref:Nucleotidyltransferase family protein n=1 Tax=Vagococcus carniphilus TaxID=218144 RepID=A0A430B540_9ENTE|nr:nucleotidyltransferase family protein [Vagococcus carniphilus]QNN71903.1 nucleotidyltransferase family protein [Vagococcus carniphilus]RSU15470.1 hypothetical protein CBF28_07010 [Vagococcus carniphilus]
MNTDIEKLISSNKDLMRILTIIDSLDLADCWLCAGAIRNFLWDLFSNQEVKLITDIDVVFYDPLISYEETCLMEQKLIETYPDYDWELKNQVYMHYHNPNAKEYLGSRDAISKFPEQCTAIGARLNASKKVELFIPYGTHDLTHFIVQPTPFFLEDTERMKLYVERVTTKGWHKKWPCLEIILPD